jgi:tripeptide aminopeptidase
LYGSRAMDFKPFKSKWGVVFDSDGPVGTIIIQAPGTNNFDVTIKGRAAHAGAEPEKGINAIAVASEAIAAMNLGRLDAETTANVGLIKGGAARNVVPEICEIKLETRSFRPSKLERQTKRMVRALERAAKNHHAQADIKVHHPYESYRLTKKDAIVQHVSAAVARIGRAPKLGVTGGGSDGNIFNAQGIACVVVSIGIEKMHSTSEFIPVQELFKCGELAFELVKA